MKKFIVIFSMFFGFNLFASQANQKTFCSFVAAEKKVLDLTNKFRANPALYIKNNNLKINLNKKCFSAKTIDGRTVKSCISYDKKPTLKWNDKLAQIARQHSRNMADGKVPLGHDGFQNRFNSFNQWAKTQGKYAKSIAENVYFTTIAKEAAKQAVNGWVLDPGIVPPGHRINLLSNNTHVGVGICKSKQGKWFFTQIFGTY